MVGKDIVFLPLRMINSLPPNLALTWMMRLQDRVGLLVLYWRTRALHHIGQRAYETPGSRSDSSSKKPRKRSRLKRLFTRAACQNQGGDTTASAQVSAKLSRVFPWGNGHLMLFCPSQVVYTYSYNHRVSYSASQGSRYLLTTLSEQMSSTRAFLQGTRNRIST